jgi:hypothetical protein
MYIATGELHPQHLVVVLQYSTILLTMSHHWQHHGHYNYINQSLPKHKFDKKADINGLLKEFQLIVNGHVG